MSVRASIYPATNRTAWILAQRPPRSAPRDAWTPHAAFLERERLASGELADSGVVLLTNRECPWRCVMCDLWKDMLPDPVPAGAIAHQVSGAVEGWRQSGTLPVQVKLYNSGSFFDQRAVPEADYAPVARELAFARHVVVESHPRLIGSRSLRWRDQLAGSLEIALGLETAEPRVLAKLNKGASLRTFERAAATLADEGIALRAFVLLHPPFLASELGVTWAVKSAAFAFSCGASAVAIIPTRAGNGAMERLRAAGEWQPPTLADLEAAQGGALALGQGRVFADTWGLEPFADCAECLPARRARIEAVNHAQLDLPRVSCARCGGERSAGP